MAGKHMGFDDDYKGKCRGTLFQDVVRICEYHKPKIIFCENVKGLTIHDKEQAEVQTVPIQCKVALTIKEAAEYSNIGINKLECLLRSPRCPFVLYVGKKKLVKRKEFEKFISDNIEI